MTTDWSQKMTQALQLNGKGERTQQAYVRTVRMLRQFYDKSPELISEEELQNYFLGHARLETTMVYLHLTNKGQQDAWQKINDLMKEL